MDPEDSSLEQKVSNYGLSPSSERVVDVIIDYRHVASSLATFLQERGYAPGRFNVKKTGTKFSRTQLQHGENPAPFLNNLKQIKATYLLLFNSVRRYIKICVIFL